MLFNNKSAASNNAPVVSAFDASILEAASKYQFLFKLELNANPSKVVVKKSEGKYKEGGVVTNLGGCGQLSRNSKNDTAFFYLVLRPIIADKELGKIVNPDFNLPLFHASYQEDPTVAAMNAALVAAGQPTLPTAGNLGTKLVSSNKLASMLNAFYGTPDVKMYFNNVQRVLSEDTIELMESEAGLLTVWFAMDVSTPKAMIDHNGQPMLKVDSIAIHAEFEAGKTASIIRPRKVVPATRQAAALSILLSDDEDTVLNAHGNVELPEIFFGKIEEDRNAFLDSVGTGKKAHKEFKEALELSVANGQWDKDAEYKLYAIARRGLNIHYTMKNHDIFIAKMKELAGSNVVVINEPVKKEPKVSPITQSVATNVVVDEDDDEDFGFVPNIALPSVPSAVVEDDDVDIVI